MRCLAAAACLADGTSCAAPDQCCSQRCVPDYTGVRSCRSACVPVGASCGVGGDCCDGFCGGEPGHTVCLRPSDSDGGVVQCAGAGEACDPRAPACCAGTQCVPLVGGGTYCVTVVQ
jgi:hypothetical protein